MKQAYETIDTIVGRLSGRMTGNTIKGVGELILLSATRPLASVTKNSITLIGNDLTPKLKYLHSQTDSAASYSENLFALMTSIETHVTGINHWGVGYRCPDIKNEVEFYQELVEDTPFKLYEEVTSVSDTRWLFIGDATDPDTSLFEVVLYENNSFSSDWYPHIQIDLNTDIDPLSLNAIISQTVGSDFITWKMDIPDYGTVLYMGKAGTVQDITIYLGLGTVLRDTTLHRTQLIRL